MKEKNNFFKLLDQAQNILISAHINPDGDAIGSSFGLALALRNMDKNAYVIKNDDFPTNLDFLYREDLYYNDEFDDIDLFIALDSGDLKRIGKSIEYFEKANKTACIDHHYTNEGYADVDIIIDSSSTCEILAQMLDDNNVYITKEAATYFYLGILTDTYRFNYESSTSNTLRVAADLLDLGANKNFIHENLYDRLNPNLLYFETEIIKNATYVSDNIIIAKVSHELVNSFGLDMFLIEGMVSKLRAIDNIEVSALVIEDEEDRQKISLRSQKEVDVSKIAKEFGGGGHIRAAGARTKGSLDEVFNQLVKRLEKLNEEWSFNN